MIDFYYWPTPNGWKVSIMLEETSLPYRLIPVNIGKGDQFTPEFLAISPNNRMPAIVDHDDPDGKLPIFESGPILLHLAEKSGRFAPTGRRARKEMLENVWNLHEDTETRAIDNFIVRLRRYIEPDPSRPRHLITVRGLGYQFVAHPQALSS